MKHSIVKIQSQSQSVITKENLGNITPINKDSEETIEIQQLKKWISLIYIVRQKEKEGVIYKEKQFYFIRKIHFTCSIKSIY